MHRLLPRSVANNVALKFASWKDRERPIHVHAHSLIWAWLGEAFRD